MGETERSLGYDPDCFSIDIRFQLPPSDGDEIVEGYAHELTEHDLRTQLREWKRTGVVILGLAIEGRSITSIDRWHGFVEETLPELLASQG